MINYNKNLKPIFLFLFCLILFCGYSQDFYWETPEALSKRNGQFLQSASNGNISAAIWEEAVKKNESEGNIFISMAVHINGDWNVYERISEPIAYAARIPSIASIAVGNDNTILAAYIKNRNTIIILKSIDGGQTFEKKEIISEMYDLLSPYISVLSNGSYMLCISHGAGENFSLYYSLSKDGIEWTDFIEFNTAKKNPRSFLPVHTAAGNTDVIVFQLLDSINDKMLYKLYSSYSPDGGKSWSVPVNITGEDSFQNQRPHILYIEEAKKIYAVWERSSHRSSRSTVVFAELNTVGERVSEIKELSTQRGSVFTPKIILYKGSPVVVWTEEYEKKSALYIAIKNNLQWRVNTVRRINGNLLFAQPFALNDSLQLLWQEGLGTQNIMRVQPDFHTLKPELIPVDFDAKTATGKKKLSVHIRFPYDSSGIAGYAYEWSKNSPPEFIEPIITKLKTESKLTYEPEEDGVWYLGVRICDYAGNWSEMSFVACERDTTPPMPPEFDVLMPDKYGFLNSNTFEISWSKPETDIEGKSELIKGYIKNIQYVEDIKNYKNLLKDAGENILTDDIIQAVLYDKFQLKLNSSKLNGVSEKQRIENYDNGIYALLVAAVDVAGNISKPAVKFFALNKYIPYTLVSNIESRQAKNGIVSISIVGKGFTADGFIEKIYIDADGEAPYDLIFDKNDFTVVNDKLISNIKIDDLNMGKYYVGLLHSARGLYFAKESIFVDDIGNVKFGNYSNNYKYNWELTEPSKTIFYSSTIIVVLIIILFILVFSSVQIIKSLREAVEIKKNAYALLTGGVMSIEKRKQAANLKIRGGGLRTKFVLFSVTLVIAIILALTIPITAILSNREKILLAESLFSRTNVLLESLSLSAKAYLPTKNLLELELLPKQISALNEADFITITGNHINNEKEGYNFVWTTNDDDLSSKIDENEFVTAEFEINSYEFAVVAERVDLLDKEAKEKVGKLAAQIDSLTKDIMEIALHTDKKSVEHRNEIQMVIRQMEEKLNYELTNLSAKGMGSYPEFNPKEFSETVTKYLFYKPVLYREAGNNENFVHGIVYIQISTEDILAKITEAESSIIGTVFYIAVASVVVGIGGSLILASIIVSPIKKLIAHIAVITSTEDKETLADKNIKIKSKDEIGILGATINDMTNSIAEAAATSKDLTIGKEIQKMFLPLNSDSSGKKLTCAEFANDNVEFFGYYEGARSVSGDYFNYIQLDDRYYAIIKCDVAGKGVPAALIMVEVATLFLDYFQDWQFKTHGLKINYLVSRINDLIESRSFKGRFAAFTLCILDSISGEVHFCNAGDNIINIYDAASKKMKEIVLAEVSAAGVFPTSMIDMKGGFKVETIKLNKGDVLFLYTDGIEEAKRLFRNAKLQPIICAEPGLKTDEEHETHTVGQDGEELGKNRICQIIESIFAKSSFQLKKWHNPIDDEEFNFDFTSLDGSLEDAVIGLISIEKIFRMYRDPNANDTNMVKTDKKIDLFLNKHFRQYQTYCANRKPDNNANEYLYYTNIREDQQYDDLTILAIRKK